MQESRNKTDGKFVLKCYRLNIPCSRRDFQHADDSIKTLFLHRTVLSYAAYDMRNLV